MVKSMANQSASSFSDNSFVADKTFPDLDGHFASNEEIQCASSNAAHNQDETKDLNGQQWNCPTCTFENVWANGVCSMCAIGKRPLPNEESDAGCGLVVDQSNTKRK